MEDTSATGPAGPGPGPDPSGGASAVPAQGAPEAPTGSPAPAGRGCGDGWLAALALASLGPSLGWWRARVRGDPEEAWGLLVIAGLAGFLGARPARPLTRRVMAGLAMLALGVAAAAPGAPPLVRAGMALMLAFGVAAGPRLRSGERAPALALLALGLPLVASCEFFLGYPLRRVATELSAILLALGGILARPEGTGLVGPFGLVAVDAPCSGIRLLRTGLVLAAGTALAARAGASGLGIRLATASLLVVLGNAWRAAGLYPLEVAFPSRPEWLHEAVGLVCAAAVVVGILVVDFVLPVGEPAPESGSGSGVGGDRPGPRWRAGLGLALLAAVLGLANGGSRAWPAASGPGNGLPAFPGFPTEREGVALSPLPLGAREESLAAGFPGRIGRFAWGGRELVLRYLTAPTRRLHPATDCYRGLGFTVRERTLEVDPRGRTWSRFRATSPEGRSFLVRERIEGPTGAWPEASSWWFAAVFGGAEGPWWAATVAEPDPGGER